MKSKPLSRLRRTCIVAAVAFTVAGSTTPLRAEDSTVPKNASLQTLFHASSWLNGIPTRDSLRGKVVLVDVFTFDCFNCKNVTPNLRALSRTQHDGLEIIGIHSPETSYERDRDQVVAHLKTLGVTWPVAIDNDFALWHAYNVEYWPTQLIFDRRGTLRKVVIGDSQDAVVDATVNALLHEPA